MNEWSLLFFTLLMQMAIGTVLITVLYQKTLFSKLDKAVSEKVIQMPLFVAAVISAGALIASFAHLGNPLHAFSTFNHLSTSWMSREILFTALFLLLMAWLALSILLKHELPKGGIWSAVIVGVLVLLSMSATYVNTIFLHWNSALTYVAFFGTALLLGAMLTLFLLPISLKKNEVDPEIDVTGRLGITLALVGAALCLLASIAMPSINAGAPLSEALGAQTAPDNVLTITLLRYLFIAISLALAVQAVRKANLSFSLIALLLTVSAEALGRYVFFSLGG